MAHECRRDGVPCFGLSACYGHLKRAALNGGRDKLCPEELEFVGVEVRSADVRRSPGGWHQPNISAYEVSSILSAKETATLQALMDVDVPTRDQLDFLGG